MVFVFCKMYLINLNESNYALNNNLNQNSQITLKLKDEVADLKENVRIIKNLQNDIAYLKVSSVELSKKVTNINLEINDIKVLSYAHNKLIMNLSDIPAGTIVNSLTSELNSAKESKELESEAQNTFKALTYNNKKKTNEIIYKHIFKIY